MQKRKYKYLYQLICTSIILVVVPTLLFYNVFWKKSFNEINHLNAEYYDNVLTAFSSSFTNEISEFKRWVITFGINSRSSQQEGGVFYHGIEMMKEQVYYYREALEELSQYSQKLGYDKIGTYYFDEDCVLVDGVKYTSDRYIKDGLGIEENRAWIKAFFSAEQYENGKVVLAPLYDADKKSEAILVGVCTVLGKNKEKALMFYQMDYEDINFFQVSAQDINQEKYYVLDYVTHDILLSIGADRVDYDVLESAIKEGVISGLLSDTQVEGSEYYLKWTIVKPVDTIS